ncbi:Nitrogen permease regulator 2 [Arachnomyces sp. PD_36]|nr:Nitrogen permease regulator 2 [Arachnomyces sp. PD_36]
MIKAIFYSKFDTQEGPKVVHQVPDGAIVPSRTSLSQQPLFAFLDISFFVIPRQELCGNLLHVCAGGYRILGYPICMKSSVYDRNEFIFNFCIVLTEDEDFSTYKSVVHKLADLMRGLEEQSGFLSRDPSKGGEGKVHSLCETLMEDLNNYCECMIPIDELNTLNIKLFPLYPYPPSVKAWQVPLFTVRYETFMDENWDLTMQRIVPYINGVNSVRIISTLADADFRLTCRAIKHLLYYGCLFLLDIFSFSAIYAPTAQFSSTIACDEGMQRECARYVNTRFAPGSTTLNAPTTPLGDEHRGVAAAWYSGDDIWPLVGGGDSHKISKGRDIVDGVGIVELYAALRQGQNVKQWYTQHSHQLANIDVRRFITFGIIKGFLYRVHKYAYATGHPAPTPQKTSIARSGSVDLLSPNPAVRTPSISLSSTTNNGSGTNSYHQRLVEEAEREREREHEYEGGSAVEEEDDEDDDDSLLEGGGVLPSRYLDGMHCFDQICTELEISEKDLTGRLKRYSEEVQIIHR